MHNVIRWCLDSLFPPRVEELLIRSAPLNILCQLAQPTIFKEFVTLLPYQEPLVKAAVHEAKFFYNHQAHRLLAEVVQEYLNSLPDTNTYMCVPIPLSRRRYRERGYNQVAEILRYTTANLDQKLLVRMRHTRPQTELKRSDRLKNLVGAFTLRTKDTDYYRDKHIIIVDDVLTTGATLEAARVTLAPLHPASIICLAIAH